MPTETTIAHLREEIAELYSVGARGFAVLPVKIPAFGDVAIRLNPVLAELAATLRLEGATIRLSHWGEFFDKVMEHAASYGITNTKAACAGRAIFDQDETPKGDPKTFYFFHEGHPSTAVHQIVGEKLAQEILEEKRS